MAVAHCVLFARVEALAPQHAIPWLGPMRGAKLRIEARARPYLGVGPAARGVEGEHPEASKRARTGKRNVGLPFREAVVKLHLQVVDRHACEGAACKFLGEGLQSGRRAGTKHASCQGFCIAQTLPICTPCDLWMEIALHRTDIEGRQGSK